MRAILTVSILLGATAAAFAGDTYSDYRDYFEEKPVALDRAKHRSARARSHPAENIDPRRYDDGLVSENPKPLKPGHRSAAGFYVPPDYSTHPRSPTDFEGSASEASGAPSPFSGVNTPNPFGGLGTRR